MHGQSARRTPWIHYDRYDATAAALLCGLVVLVLLTYDRYAVSNDEGLQQRYGELIVAYYSSGFADRALFKFDNLYLYGGLFDLTTTLIGRILPCDVYSIRHILCAGIGIGGIAAAWATARLIAGSRAALIAATLLSASGVWYGAMFNHTKDITFAAAMMGAIYTLLRATRDLPRPRLRHVLLFGALSGAALGVRAIGLLLVAYLGLAIMLTLCERGPDGRTGQLAFAGRSLLAFVPGLLVGYLIMIASWPWAALDPLNPLRAIVAFAQFHYPIRDLLAGVVYAMDDMPRWYLPTYLAIKLPLAMLAGVAIALLAIALPRALRSMISARTRTEVALIAVMAALPIAAQVISRGPGFSGMRHFTFVVPPLAVLAGFGLDAAIAAFGRWRAAAGTAAGATLVALVLSNGITLARLHPHEYLFYNPLVGGLQGAAGRFATDYWVNVMPEAVGKLESYLASMERESGRARRDYNVAICAQRLQFEHVADDRLHWTEIWEEADFFIAPTHMACDAVLEGKVIATIERLGVVIGVVKDRRMLVDLEAAARVKRAVGASRPEKITSEVRHPPR
jgi:Dolichyl-phosphate-mannose-protein mannosyltransferase